MLVYKTYSLTQVYIVSMLLYLSQFLYMLMELHILVSLWWMKMMMVFHYVHNRYLMEMSNREYLPRHCNEEHHMKKWLKRYSNHVHIICDLSFKKGHFFKIIGIKCLPLFVCQSAIFYIHFASMKSCSVYVYQISFL